MPVVPTAFAAPGEAMDWPDAAEVVVKPAVSAGSIDTRVQCYGADDAARGRGARPTSPACTPTAGSAMAQPYLDAPWRASAARPPSCSWRATLSHACRKGPMLVPGLAMVGGLFVEEDIRPATRHRRRAGRWPHATLAAIPGGAVALRAGGRGPRRRRGPVVLELELVEPSLFLAYAEGAADRVAGGDRRPPQPDPRGGPTARA